MLEEYWKMTNVTWGERVQDKKLSAASCRLENELGQRLAHLNQLLNAVSKKLAKVNGGRVYNLRISQTRDVDAAAEVDMIRFQLWQKQKKKKKGKVRHVLHSKLLFICLLEAVKI